MEEKDHNTERLLRMSLKASVPMWFADLRKKTPDYWERRRTVCSKHIAAHGDIIMFRSKKPGQTAEAFNRLAEGCALLLLITGHPFEIFGLKFLPDGTIHETNRDT